ncbi:hypothetical protein PTI98_011447 [Pleurotus ostreatus]|nr:hypothetical protein PTI98_011447 [Pleurotus ostreatus]
MSTLAAQHSSFQAASPELLQPRRPRAAVPESDVEPSDEWKRNMRQRIEEGLRDMVFDAKNNYDSKLKERLMSNLLREQLYQEYQAAMAEIRKLAHEQFQVELERERQERRWAAGIALTPGWDEALKQEQQSILDTIQKDQAGRLDDQPIQLSPQSPNAPFSAAYHTDVRSPPVPIPDPPPRRDTRPTTSLLSEYAPRRDTREQKEPFRDRDTMSVRSGDSGYVTGTTMVDEAEEVILRPKRRSDASSYMERPTEDIDRPPEPLGRPIERPLGRSVSERHASSPPRVPEFWKPSISPEEDLASARPYQMNRRGSTASMKSNNSGSASYRAPATNPIPERIREQVEVDGDREREREREREKEREKERERERDRERERERERDREAKERSKTLERQPTWVEKPRERERQERPDARQGSTNTLPRNFTRPPQTVEELELQSMQHTGAYTTWFSDPSARRYQAYRSASRPSVPDEFDFRLPPDLTTAITETRPYSRTPSIGTSEHPSYFADHETDARLVSAATGRRASLSSRRPEDRSQPGMLSSKPSREYSLTMEQARQPLSSPSIGGLKHSPINDDVRFQPSSNTRDLLDDTGSLRRASLRSSEFCTPPPASPNGYGYPTTASNPVPITGRSKYDPYARSSPNSRDWNNSPQSVDAKGDVGSFTQYGHPPIEARRPLSSRPSLQSFRPELPVLAAEEEMSDDMDMEPIPEQPTRHRGSDADLRPYRGAPAVDRYKEARRLEEQVKRDEEAKREAKKREDERLEAKRQERQRRKEEEARKKAEDEDRKQREIIAEIKQRAEATATEARRKAAERERLRLEEQEAARREQFRREEEARREQFEREEAARKADLDRLETMRMIAEAEAAREEERRQKIAEEAAAERRREEEAEQRRVEIQRKEGELAARAAEVRRREEAEAREREKKMVEEAQAEARRKEAEVRRKEQEARRKEEEVRLKEEEARKKEIEIKLKEEEARKKVAEMLRKEEETRKKEEEIKRREEDLRRREAEVKRREDEARRREEEKMRLEQEKERLRREEEKSRAQQQEEFRRREEDIRRRAEERKRHDSEGSGSYPGTSPTSSSWTSSHSHRSNTAPHVPSSSPTDRASTSTPSRSNTASWSTWGSTAAAGSTYTNGSRPAPAPTSTPKPTPSTPRSTSTPSASPSTPISEAEWARRQAEQARKQQEAFRKEQERIEMERQARQGRILTKDEVHRLFQTHETQWSRLTTLEELTWDSFPWPMLKKPVSSEEITPAAVSAYVLSPHYPDKTKSDKDRIKEYIRRWHPDRFETKYLVRVVEDDRERVKEGAGTVVRNLNDLLTRTNAPSLF